MNEDFLSFVWKFKLYSSGITTTSGEPVVVLAPGEQHNNSGPDFFNARIRIGDTLWAGNVEIHTLASDWYRHSHHADDAYSGIILHVVYEADCDIMLSDQRTVPALELKSFVNPLLSDRYKMLMSSAERIACRDWLPTVPGIIRTSWLDRMLAERLEQKSDLIREALHYCNGNYEHAFFHVLAAGFGFHVNTLPFSMLARVLPLKLLLKHADDPILVEALVFGQAGFLTPSETEEPDAYFQALQQHYSFLALKYGLLPIEKHLWKFLRMRPVNFPTVRLAQFASLSVEIPGLFSSLVEGIKTEQLLKKLNVCASEYWNTHYLPGKPATYREKRLGKESAAVIAINSVAPFLFMYGKWKGEPDKCSRAFELLHALPPERNHLVDDWGQDQFKPVSSYDSQALIELSNQYCQKKKCLNCSIGTHLLRDRLSDI